MEKPLIAIFDSDHIRGAGLRHFIHLHIEQARVVTADSPASLAADPAISFATSEAIAANAAYFFTRRNSTVIISSTPSADFPVIDPTAPEDIIIERIGTILSSLSSASRQADPVNLSPREIEVLRLLATGHISKEIADRLSISINTVLSHRKNITAKLGIKSISGLGIYAVMNGLVSDRDI